MSRLLLHMAPASPPSLSVMMLCDLLKLPLQCRMVKLLELEQKTPEFRKINPLGTVPVLEDGDFIVADSHAIIKYLMRKYGGDMSETLYPSEPRARAIVDQRLFFNSGVFFNKFAIVSIPSFLDGVKAPTQKQLDDIDFAYSAIEQYLQNSRYLAADRLTVADLSVGATATTVQHNIHKIDTNRFPRTAEWLSRLEEEPVFQKVNAPGVAFLGKLLKKFWKQ